MNPTRPVPFRRIALSGRTDDARVAESMGLFARHLLERGLEVVVSDSADASSLPPQVRGVPEASLAEAADLMVAIGGDGTLLYAAHLTLGRSVPLLGINRGRLGFLADVSPGNMLERFDDVLAGRYETEARTLLVARLEQPGHAPQACHALNDIVVQKHDTGRMIEFETWIGGRYVNTHGGDGLVVATSTGSTAYALSCGGPIIHPGLDAIVLAPICPHTLSDRPIVVGRDAEIAVRLVARPAARARVTHDGMLLGELDADARLVIAAAPDSVTLLHPPGHDYFRILRSKLHWGRSGRNGDQEGGGC
jgi:NAD+ kinase